MFPWQTEATPKQQGCGKQTGKYFLTGSGALIFWLPLNKKEFEIETDPNSPNHQSD